MLDKFKVGVFITDPQTRNGYIGVSILEALKRRGDVLTSELLRYNNVVNRSRDLDILIAVGGAGASVIPLLRAAKAAACSVLWTTEDPYELNNNMLIARHFDLIFSNDYEAASKYPSAEFLPLAASSDFHNTSDIKKDKIFDVLFVGTAWPNRVEQINDLLAYLPTSIRVKFGLSINPFLTRPEILDSSIISNFRAPPQELNKLASLSKTILSIDREFSSSSDHNAGSSPPPRVFEAGLSKTPQIYWSTSKILGRFYNPQKEIVQAKSAIEAARCIIELTRDDARAKNIGDAAYNRTRSEHLYDHRIDNIFNKIRKSKNLSINSSCHGVHQYEKQSSRTRRPRILFITHNILGIAPYGGVEHYQDTLRNHLIGYDIFFMYPARSNDRMVLANREGTVSYSVPKLHSSAVSDHAREQLFQQILVQHQIDLVHIHHLIGGHSFFYAPIAKSYGIPVVLTAHDYFLECSQFNLIDHRGIYCGINSPDTQKCDICLSVRGIAPPGAQSRRRHAIASMLSSVDNILHNTEYTKNKLTQIYPQHSKKNMVVGMTGLPQLLQMLADKRGDKISPDKISNIAPLRVSILGNFTKVKGAALLTEMFHQMNDWNVLFYIDGRIDEDVAVGLSVGRFKNVIVRGAYNSSDAVQRLTGIDVSVHFSIWPETYCISLDEARAAGIVPIVACLGALAERVKHNMDGFVVDADAPYELMNLIGKLISDRDVLEQLRTPAEDIVRQSAKHLRRIQDCYRSLLSASSYEHIAAEGSQRFLHPNDLGIRLNHPHWDSADLIWDENPIFTVGPVLRREARLLAATGVPISNIESLEIHDGLSPSHIKAVRSDEIVIARQRSIRLRKSIGEKSILLSIEIERTNAIDEVEIILASTKSFAFKAASFDDEWGVTTYSSKCSVNELECGTYELLVRWRVGNAWMVERTERFLHLSSYNYMKEEYERFLLHLDNLERRNKFEKAIAKKTDHRESSFRHLRKMVGALSSGRSKVLGHLDQLGPESNIVSRTISRSHENIARGWVVDVSTKSSLKDMRIIIRQGKTEVAAEVVVEPRSDIVAHIGSDDCLLSGFHCVLDPSPFSGEAQLTLCGVGRDGTMRQLPLGTLEIG